MTHKIGTSFAGSASAASACDADGDVGMAPAVRTPLQDITNIQFQAAAGAADFTYQALKLTPVIEQAASKSKTQISAAVAGAGVKKVFVDLSVLAQAVSSAKIGTDIDVEMTQARQLQSLFQAAEKAQQLADLEKLCNLAGGEKTLLTKKDKTFHKIPRELLENLTTKTNSLQRQADSIMGKIQAIETQMLLSLGKPAGAGVQTKVAQDPALLPLQKQLEHVNQLLKTCTELSIRCRTQGLQDAEIADLIEELQERVDEEKAKEQKRNASHPEKQRMVKALTVSLLSTYNNINQHEHRRRERQRPRQLNFN